jgi:hypothetical protein
MGAEAQLKDEIAWHRTTLAEFWRIMPLWILLVPLIAAAIIVALDYTAVAPFLIKADAEIVAPSILFVALVVARWLAWKNPHVYFKWPALFALALFLRELHFLGTNNGFYVAFIILMWWASKNRWRMQPYIYDKRFVTVSAAMVWTYLVSKSFDRHYWDFLVHTGVNRDLFEENLENAGHLLFLVLVIMSAIVQVPGIAATPGEQA